MAFELYHLDSGVTALLEQRSDQFTTSAGFFILAGPVDENDKCQGLAHLVEHMLLNGTERRTAEDIAAAFDFAGGHLQAYTAKEYTCLFARVLASETEWALEVMVDLLTRPAFEPDRFEREKAVVGEEARLWADTPQRHVVDLAYEALWPASPLGQPTLGNADAVLSLTPEDGLLFHASYYRPERTVVALSSPLPSRKMLKLLEQLVGFSTAWREPGQFPAHVRELAPACPSLVRRQAATQQAHLCLAFPGPPLGDIQENTAILLSTLLGGSVAGRLPRILRREDGLVYLVSTSVTAHVAGGIFLVYAGTSPRNLHRILLLAARELGKIAGEGLHFDELDRVRQRVKGTLASAQEQPGDRTAFAGKEQLLLGRVRDIKRQIDALDAIKVEDIRDAARSLFQPEAMAVAIIGPPDAAGEENLDLWQCQARELLICD